VTIVVGIAYWEAVMDHLKTMYKTRQNATDEEIAMVKQKARDIHLGTAYLMPGNKHRYGKMIEDTINV